jgi:hypothetical protein
MILIKVQRVTYFVSIGFETPYRKFIRYEITVKSSAVQPRVQEVAVIRGSQQLNPTLETQLGLVNRF